MEPFPDLDTLPPDAGRRAVWLAARIRAAGGRIRVVHGEEQRAPMHADVLYLHLELESRREGPDGPTLTGYDLHRSLAARRAAPDSLTAGTSQPGRNTGGLLAGPVPVHSTETTDEVWDGPRANMARLGDNAPHSRASAISAWADPTSRMYRYLHHSVSPAGRVGPANLHACMAGVEHLNGEQQTIPADHRPGVYAHLARHLADAGHDVPPLRQF
jgi:hypothetical protein